MIQEIPAAFRARGACSREEPQPKFFSANRMSPFLDSLEKLRPLILHHMLCQLLGIGLVEIAGRNDRIRIDIRSKFPDSSFDLHPILTPQSAIRNLQSSFSNYFLRMADPSFDRTGCSHGRAGEVNLTSGIPHPSAKITVCGGQCSFPFG